MFACLSVWTCARLLERPGVAMAKEAGSVAEEAAVPAKASVAGTESVGSVGAVAAAGSVAAAVQAAPTYTYERRAILGSPETYVLVGWLQDLPR